MSRRMLILTLWMALLILGAIALPGRVPADASPPTTKVSLSKELLFDAAELAASPEVNPHGRKLKRAERIRFTRLVEYRNQQLALLTSDRDFIKNEIVEARIKRGEYEHVVGEVNASQSADRVALVIRYLDGETPISISIDRAEAPDLAAVLESIQDSRALAHAEAASFFAKLKAR